MCAPRGDGLADDRLVLTLPLFHMHGLGVGVHGTLLTGASMAIAPFSADGVLDLAAAEKATLFFGVPTMYVRLVASPRVRRARIAAAVRVRDRPRSLPTCGARSPSAAASASSSATA